MIFSSIALSKMHKINTMLFKEEEVQKLESRCYSIIEKKHTVISNVIRIQLSDSVFRNNQTDIFNGVARVQLYLTKKSSRNKLLCISKAFCLFTQGLYINYCIMTRYQFRITSQVWHRCEGSPCGCFQRACL